MAYTAQEWFDWKLAMLQAGFTHREGSTMYSRWDGATPKAGAPQHRQHIVLYDGFGGHWFARFRDWESPMIYGAPAVLAYAELHNWGQP